MNHKRVERIWRVEGLKVPGKQPKKGRLWLNDGSCIRLRPEYRDHVWSYDVVADRTSDGKAFRILTVIDEHTRECLAMVVKRSITSQDVLERLYMLFLVRGVPEHIRSDNGPEFTFQGSERVVIRSWGEGHVHRAGQSLGERVCRVIQREVQGRTPQQGGVWHPDRSPDTNRVVEKRI